MYITCEQDNTRDFLRTLYVNFLTYKKYLYVNEAWELRKFFKFKGESNVR